MAPQKTDFSNEDNNPDDYDFDLNDDLLSRER